MNKKFLGGLIVLISFLFGKTIMAQPHSFISIADGPLKLIAAQNGTFYGIRDIPSCVDYRMKVHFFNRKGELLSSSLSGYFYNSSPSIVNITGCTLPNNHLVLVFGNIFGDLYAYETDSIGNVYHQTKLECTAPAFTFHTILPVSDGFYLAGNTFTPLASDSSKAVIVRLNTDLSLQWSRTYRLQGNAAAALEFNTMKIKDQKLICAGHYYKLNPAPVRKRPLICEIDTAGNFVSARYFMVDSSSPNFFQEYDFVQMDFTPSGRIYLQADNLVSEHGIFKLESNFDLLWLKATASGYATALCAGYNEDVLVSPDLFIRNAVIRLDSSGNVVANHVTASTGAVDISNGQVKQIQRHDCGFLAANQLGSYFHIPASLAFCADSIDNTPMPYQTQTNVYAKPAFIESSLFNGWNVTSPSPSFSAAPTAITSICATAYNCQGGASSLNERVGLPLLVYPQPADDRLVLQLPENLIVDELTLSDLYGQIVFKADNTHDNSIITAHLPAGIYVLQCRILRQQLSSLVIIRH